MNRRQYLATLAAAGSAISAPAAPPNPIQLHVELDVLPGREKEMIANFRKVFRPTIRKQPGFVGVTLLQMRSALAGPAPSTKYRLIISFKTEEERLTWVKTDDHQKAWPTIENTLRDKKFTAVLYDIL